ncbi:hypothetical protein AAFF_G00236050 [Aldrovandia affinis]|uniref:Uncharacterized protein n=1 Tax=Aldrovandia affinis TaxID=143900 RepID=A0AAD7W4A1_9TELE|nr:hypothetical protein AAFF_G00236050 [Aldrovandia affinis]
MFSLFKRSSVQRPVWAGLPASLGSRADGSEPALSHHRRRMAATRQGGSDVILSVTGRSRARTGPVSQSSAPQHADV